MRDVQRFGDGPLYSDSVVFNGMVFLSGMAATDPDADLETQTRQVLDQIDRALAMAGSDKSRLLTVQVWLKDIDDWANFNRFYADWLDSTHKPCRSAVQAELPENGYLVKIACIAAQ